MNKKLFRAVVLIATALCFCIIMILINTNNDETSLTEDDENIGIENNLAIESKEYDSSYGNYAQIEVGQETETIVTATPVPSVEQTDFPAPTISALDYGFAILKITTSKKIGTYTVMPDVDEDTLKDNTGWLPSSSLPGDVGLCVFMGHRDTDFSILKFIKIGDALTVTFDGEIFNYEVTKIEIVNSDNDLWFSAVYRSSLALVTCYPFYYSEHAPKKLVVYTELKIYIE